MASPIAVMTAFGLFAVEVGLPAAWMRRRAFRRRTRVLAIENQIRASGEA